LSQSLARALRERQYDVVHLREEGLIALHDEGIVEKARSEHRIVITHDLDFSRLMALSGATSPSTITFRLSDMRPHNVLIHLEEALDAFGDELQQGALVTVGDLASRCRRLPIYTRPTSSHQETESTEQ
jgi:predicted nuclease of predicted toxin-antitoxin system